jgi:hypothetical protein
VPLQMHRKFKESFMFNHTIKSIYIFNFIHVVLFYTTSTMIPKLKFSNSNNATFQLYI